MPVPQQRRRHTNAQLLGDRVEAPPALKFKMMWSPDPTRWVLREVDGKDYFLPSLVKHRYQPGNGRIRNKEPHESDERRMYAAEEAHRNAIGDILVDWDTPFEGVAGYL